MRDPDRIDDFCARLARMWKTLSPDWRFGQLMSNLLGDYYAQTRRDPFFVEDDEMISWMEGRWNGEP